MSLVSAISSSAGLIGGLTSLSIAALWMWTFHKKFCLSLWKTTPFNAYGVYTSFGYALRTHFWYLLVGTTKSRESLEAEVKEIFLSQLGAPLHSNALVTHSCRAIFYYVIKTLLDEASERDNTVPHQIKIALPALQFGSFYRLMKSMEKAFDCKILFYEMDLKQEDWTLDTDSVDEKEIATCDLVLVQHLFGLPFEQQKVIDLAKKHNKPILEDCVQSGSLYGKYSGNAQSDIIMYSGGLDKTPQCFGGGLGFFRDSPHGNHLYKKCFAMHEARDLDTRKARFIGCFNNAVHSLFAHSTFGINYFLGLIAYVWVSERGDYINWYQLSLKIRKNKAITPFQHSESSFLKKPNVYHLLSIIHGLSRTKDYRRIAAREVQARNLMLANIPSKYHRVLFPWFTKETLERHAQNEGISEFSWVFSPKKDRGDLCEFLNQHFVVSLINTTWEASEGPGTTRDSKSNTGSNRVATEINDNLVYLPNLNMSPDHLIIRIGKVLTQYCEHHNL